MANLDSNLNPKNLSTVTFTFLYDKSEETINIDSPKVNDLHSDGTNKDLAVQFTVKDWSCKTQSKTARTCNVIWNEHFTHKIKYKHISDEELSIRVIDSQTSEVIGSSIVSLKDIKVDEKTVCSLSIHLKEQKSRGEIIFGVRPSNKSVNVTISKAKNLSRVMREYNVLARLLSSSDSEKHTSKQKTAQWNEEIVFKGEDARRGVLVLQVVGENSEQEQVLGEARLNIADVKYREHGRILALQEPIVDSISFSTCTKEEGQTITLEIRVFGVGNIKTTAEKTKVYVQIKQKCEGVVIKKEKTPKTTLTENTSFKSSAFTFTFDKDMRKNTKFIFSVKTQKNAYATEKPVIGKVVIGPFSDGRWYKEVLQVKNREIPHSLHLEMC